MKELVRLARLLARHKGRIALGVGLALASLLANIGLLALSSWFIATMAIAGSLGLAMDYTLPAAGLRALAILRSLGRYAERLANHDATFRILGSLRLWLYRRLEPLAPAGTEGYGGGDLLARLGADVDELDDFYVRGLVPALVALLAGFCILPFLGRYDLRLAWIDGLGLAAAGLAVPAALAASAARPGRERILRSAELRAAVVEDLGGMAELLVLGAADGRADLALAKAEALDRCQRRLGSLKGLGEASMLAASSLAAWAAALVLVGLVGSGTLPRADMAMLTVFVLASFETVLPLPAAIQKLAEMSAAAGRVFELIDAEPPVQERPSSRAGTAAPPPPHAAALSVRDLAFRYAPGSPPVFEGLSFELSRGSRLGLAGPSGVGKSSLVGLLLRFREYQGGSIQLDSRDIRSMAPAEARSYFSVLPQSPFLFHASIRENLLVAAMPDGAPEGHPLGGPEGGPDELEARLLGALADAQLPRPVSGEAREPRREPGLDSDAGEMGGALSRGEIQRVAMARAFLKEAPIYILDEPTEGLDDSTAEALLESISGRLAGKSLIVISHLERDFAIVDQVLRMGR
jgi:ATP-binding cassette subfamily C protein CydC